jgi:hypothetical protein|tara:strand:+ start:1989 stop:2249 length:261 start_codon:yes stop_codon:yes gene_type:complete
MKDVIEILKDYYEEISSGKYNYSVETDGRDLLVTIPDGRTYRVRDNMGKIFGLIDHLAGKNWFNKYHLKMILCKISSFKGLEMHPF